MSAPVEFAVWAPLPERVRIQVDGAVHDMTRGDGSWWRAEVDASPESDYGFRAFRELLAQAERNGIIALHEGQAPGDPAVDFPDAGQADKAFDPLRATLLDLQGDDEEVPLSGLKDQLRKRDPNWSEKDLGYAGFLQFVKAAAAKGSVNMEWDDTEGDYFLYVPD